MSETLIEQFVNDAGPILVLDIGSGTQDVLLALPKVNPENWPKFVLPSPERRLSKAIAKATNARENIFLFGENMGGGFSQALRKHLAQGFKVFATKEAALAIHDDLERVKALGVEICSRAPKDAWPLHLTDYAPDAWRTFLQSLGLPNPRIVLTSAQDHGFSKLGNRKFRMQIWQDLLEADPNPANWITQNPRPELTRLATLQRAHAGFVADTGISALLAFLADPNILDRSYQLGLTLLNVGNTHTLAALVYQGKVCALYEHHTVLLTPEILAHDLEEFRLGWLPAEQVQLASGHGTVYGLRPEEAEGFAPTYITGPLRKPYLHLGQAVNPAGDMMVAGCFGLLWGIAQQNL